MKISKMSINNSDNSIFGEWIKNPEKYQLSFNNAEPFEYCIIDNFLKPDIAKIASKNYPENMNDYHYYNNPLEKKYAYDNIENMNENIQNIFYALCSETLISSLKTITKKEQLQYDNTCHGGGLHILPNNGRLHLHLDYEKHPILDNLQRYLNIILYLSEDWKQEYGGETELWNENVSECIFKSPVKFNSALIFKTTEKSWHGIPEPIKCPEDIYRKSLAFYYLIPLENDSGNKLGTDSSGYRTKAVFTKRPEDKYDPLIEKLYSIRPYRRINSNDLIN